MEKSAAEDKALQTTYKSNDKHVIVCLSLKKKKKRKCLNDPYLPYLQDFLASIFLTELTTAKILVTPTLSKPLHNRMIAQVLNFFESLRP